MSKGTPTVICCGHPLVWVVDDDFFTTSCAHCGRLFSFFEPDTRVYVQHIDPPAGWEAS